MYARNRRGLLTPMVGCSVAPDVYMHCFWLWSKKHAAGSSSVHENNVKVSSVFLYYFIPPTLRANSYSLRTNLEYIPFI